MARIRTVKPELFRHEQLFALEREHGMPLRFSWIGLFTVADREGRFSWKPNVLKLDVLPYDADVDFEQVLSIFHSAGLLHKYEHGGDIYGVIPKWHLHQVINTREAQSRIPAPDASVLIEPQTITRHIPAAVKRVVIAGEHKCNYCSSTDELQFDHIVPFSKGGTHHIENIQLLCRACNLHKSDKQLHVHAQGEGNMEGKGKGREGNMERRAPRRPRSVEIYNFDFESIYKAYPKRHGDTGKGKGIKSLAEKITTQELYDQALLASQNYAHYIASEGKLETSFVKKFSTFFGSDDPWKEYIAYSAPAAMGNTGKTQGNQAALTAYLNSLEGNANVTG